MSQEVTYERPTTATAKSSIQSKDLESPSNYEASSFNPLSITIPFFSTHLNKVLREKLFSYKIVQDKNEIQLNLSSSFDYRKVKEEIQESLIPFGEVNEIKFDEKESQLKILTKDGFEFEKINKGLQSIMNNVSLNKINQSLEKNNEELKEGNVKEEDKENEDLEINIKTMKQAVSYLTEKSNYKFNSQIFPSSSQKVQQEETSKLVIESNINNENKSNNMDISSSRLSKQNDIFFGIERTTKTKTTNPNTNSNSFIPLSQRKSNTQSQNNINFKNLSFIKGGNNNTNSNNNHKLLSSISKRQNIPTPIKHFSTMRKNNFRPSFSSQQRKMAMNQMNGMNMPPISYYPYHFPVPINTGNVIRIPVPIPIPVPVPMNNSNNQNKPNNNQNKTQMKIKKENTRSKIPTLNYNAPPYEKSSSNDKKNRSSSVITNLSGSIINSGNNGTNPKEKILENKKVSLFESETNYKDKNKKEEVEDKKIEKKDLKDKESLINPIKEVKEFSNSSSNVKENEKDKEKDKESPNSDAKNFSLNFDPPSSSDPSSKNNSEKDKKKEKIFEMNNSNNITNTNNNALSQIMNGDLLNSIQKPIQSPVKLEALKESNVSNDLSNSEKRHLLSLEKVNNFIQNQKPRNETSSFSPLQPKSQLSQEKFDDMPALPGELEDEEEEIIPSNPEFNNNYPYNYPNPYPSSNYCLYHCSYPAPPYNLNYGGFNNFTDFNNGNVNNLPYGVPNYPNYPNIPLPPVNNPNVMMNGYGYPPYPYPYGALYPNPNNFNKDVIDFDKLTLETKNTVRFKTIPFRDYQLKYVSNYCIQIESDDKFDVTKRIIGKNGCFLKKILQESCVKFGDFFTKIRLRGKGSGYPEKDGKESTEPLMLCVSSLNKETYCNCCFLIEELLQKIYKDYYEYLKKNDSSNNNRKIIQIKKNEYVVTRKN